jgi:hypothetical protein
MVQDDLMIRLMAVCGIIVYLVLCAVIMEHLSPVDPKLEQVRSCQMEALQQCKKVILGKP